ncbi:MAG: RNA 2'-phosphotransferase [Anaerolineales bacterium]
MRPERRVELSKFLSFILRHQPEGVGLRLEPGGWVEVDDLLAACQLSGWEIDRAVLKEVVELGNKPRFSFSDEGDRIRANYGHSVEIDLGIEPQAPPDKLFHGTARKSLASIHLQGLQPKGRQWVHLSPDRETAESVGSRHGSPVVLVVAARRLYLQGHAFYHPAEGTWLTDSVPPEALEIPGD